MNHPRNSNDGGALYPDLDSYSSAPTVDNELQQQPPLQNGSINSAHDPKALESVPQTMESSSSPFQNIPTSSSLSTHRNSSEDNFNRQHNANSDTDSILNSLTRTKKNKNLAPVFTRDYHGGTSNIASEAIRKGWKGLSSLEKSLSVSLGVVSALSIALMIAVIVVGVQLNEKESCTIEQITDLPCVTPPVTGAPPDDRCNSTLRPRPPRRSTTTASPFSNVGGLPPAPDTCTVSKTSVMEKPSQKSNVICLSPTCSRVAGEILSSLDMNADPCQNFHQFACGGRLKTDPILGNARDQSQVVRARLLASVKEILESDHLQNASKSFHLAQQYYHACMNPLKDDEVALAEMRILLNTMTSVPSVPPAAYVEAIEAVEISPKMHSLAVVLANIRRFLNGNFIVQLEVSADDKNSTENAIYLNHPEFGLPGVLRKLDITPPPSALQSTEPGMLDRTTQLYRNLVKKLWTLVYPEDAAYLEEMLRKLEEFEGKLKQISDEAIENTDNPAEEYYYPLKQVEIAQKISPTIAAWITEYSTNVMQDAAGSRNKTPNIILKNVKYFQGLEQVVNETAVETIEKYLKLRILLAYAPHSGQIFAELFANFKGRVEGFMGSPTDFRWQTCAKETNQYFGWTVSYHLAQSSLYKMANLKQQLHETAYYLMDSLNETLSVGLPWMASNETRKVAQRKLSKLQTFLGFPVDWLFSLSGANMNNASADSASSVVANAFVEQFYSEMKFTDALNYMQNYVEVRLWLTQKELGQAFQSNVINFTWPQLQYPSSSKAIYSEKLNYLALPFGVVDLASLADSASIIPSVQYGSVGVLMAQLLLQGFNEQASYRTASGSIAPWWDAQTRENFQNVTSCFRNQYFDNSTSPSDANATENKLVRQVILQNAALTLAYQAYHSKTFEQSVDEYLLPGLQSFTPEQLYFLTFAQSQCSAKSMVENAVNNSVEFARHFKCPLPTKEKLCRAL